MLPRRSQQYKMNPSMAPQMPMHHQRPRRTTISDEASSNTNNTAAAVAAVWPLPPQQPANPRRTSLQPTHHYRRQQQQQQQQHQPQQANSFSPIGAPQRRAFHPRPPKMGVGSRVMTSTPNVAAPSSLVVDEQVDDEPIYCEIGKSESSPGSKKTFSSSQSRIPAQNGRRSVDNNAANRRNNKIPLNEQQHQQQQQQQHNKRKKSSEEQTRRNENGIPPPPLPAWNSRRAKTQLEMRPNLNYPSRRIHQHQQQQFQYPSSWQLQQQQQQHRHQHNHLETASNFVSPYATNDSAEQIPRHVRHRMQQKAAHHGDYCSEYGFKQPNNKLDDTLSTVATESLANQSAVSAAAPTATLRKGLLWQQRDKLFSRWKERFFILTADYLQCFKKASSAGSISEMGGFIFKLRLSEIEEVELLDRKGYLTISVTLTREGSSKVLLRKPEGIRDWFHTLKTCVERCKERKGLMKTTKEFWSKKQFTDSSSMEQWILARRRIEAKYSYNNEETAADSHPMREMSKSNLNLNEKILTTTDYGFIDFPGASEVKSDFGDGESRASLSPIAQTKIVKDSSSTFSHDSGVDSMNTNSSGSVMSRQTPANRSDKDRLNHRSRSKIPTISRQTPVKSRGQSAANKKPLNNEFEVNEAMRHISLV